MIGRSVRLEDTVNPIVAVMNSNLPDFFVPSITFLWHA